jgi:hypothetical protein
MIIKRMSRFDPFHPFLANLTNDCCAPNLGHSDQLIDPTHK